MSDTDNTELHAAIARAGYADMITATDGGRVTVSVLDTEAQSALRAIRRHLPSGAWASFTGASNTDSDGDTTEDIRVKWDTQ